MKRIDAELENLELIANLLIWLNQERPHQSRHLMSRCDCHQCTAFRELNEEIELVQSIRRLLYPSPEQGEIT